MSAYSECCKIIHCMETGQQSAVPPLMKQLGKTLKNSPYQSAFDVAEFIKWQEAREKETTFIQCMKRLAERVKGKRLKKTRRGLKK